MSLIAAVNHRQMRCLEFSAPRHRHRLNALTQVAIIGDLFADNAHLFQQLDGSLEHLLPFVQLVLVRHLLVSQQFQPFLIRARQLTEKRRFICIHYSEFGCQYGFGLTSRPPNWACGPAD